MIYVLYFLITFVLLLFVYFRWQYTTIFHPKLYREEAFDDRFRFLSVVSSGGVELEGCVYEPKRYKKTLLYYGGRGQDSVGLLPKLSTCYDNIRIITFNYRGYGKSSGTPDEKSMMSDALLVYDKVHKHFGDIEIVGYSLGCSVASFVAANRSPKKLYLIAPFTSLVTLVKDIYGFTLPLLRYRFNTCENLKKTTSRTYLFISKNDNLVPYVNSIKLQKCVKNLGDFVELEGLGHVELLCDQQVSDNIKTR